MKKMGIFDTGFHDRILVRFYPPNIPNQNLTVGDSKAAALVFYHLSMLLLGYELEKVQEGPENVDEILVSLLEQRVPYSSCG